jgi:hypothetical protein
VSEKFKFYFRLIFALLGWAAITMDIYMQYFSRWRTFTIQVNFLILLFWTFSLVYYNKENKPFFLRPSIKGAIAVYITIIFFTYELIMGGLKGLEGSEFILSLIWHYIIPPAFILDYIWFTERKTIRFSHIWFWTIYPFCYSVFLTIYGLVTQIYIYPFLNLEQLGWTRYCINLFGLLLFGIFLGFIYVFMNRHLPDRALK